MFKNIKDHQQEPEKKVFHEGHEETDERCCATLKKVLCYSMHGIYPCKH